MLSNVEYIVLRMLRRFILRDRLLARIGLRVPYCSPSQNQIGPIPIVDRYFRFSSMREVSPANRQVLKIGVGATNGVGYEFAIRGAAR